MKSRVKQPELSLGDRQVLDAIADALDAHARNGERLESWRAAAFAAQLRRVGRRPRQVLSEAKTRERSAALSYAIRLELAGKNQSSKVRGQVADLYGYKDSVLTKIPTTWRAFTDWWLKNLAGNVDYAGLTRREMLERELSSIESNLPRPTTTR